MASARMAAVFARPGAHEREVVGGGEAGEVVVLRLLDPHRGRHPPRVLRRRTLLQCGHGSTSQRRFSGDSAPEEKGTPVGVVYRAQGPALGGWEDQPPAAYSASVSVRKASSNAVGIVR
eukprot:5713803-Pyramimonas_sp.AAC.1